MKEKAMMEPKLLRKKCADTVESEVKKVKRELEIKGREFRKRKLVIALFRVDAHSRLVREPRGEDSNTQPREPAASARPTMARLCVFLMVLIVMSYWSTCSLGCDLPNTDKNWNLTLLEQMRSLSHVTCLKDRKHFGFPLEKVDAQQIQKAQAIPVLRDLTQQILNLITPEDSYVPWNATLLESFRNNLYEQLKDLKACVQQLGVQEPPLTQKDLLMTVKKYIDRITVYLREKKHSPCAWEMVRAEVWRALYSSKQLLARLSEEKE